MPKLKLHWLVLIGIVTGVLLGASINRAHFADAQRVVLGDYPSVKEIQIKGKEVNDELARRVQSTWYGAALDGISRVFMNLLKMIVIPLVFFSIVSGVTGIGQAKRVGRIGAKTAAWYVTTSLLAIITGLLLVNLIGPGRGSDIQIPIEGREAYPPGSFWDVIVDMVPPNIVKAAANFDMFGVIFFSVLFGIFLLAAEEQARKGMMGFIDGGMEVMMKMTHFVISLAPVGIAALVAYTVSTSGPKVFLSLVGYVLTVFVGLAVHFLVTLPLLYWLFRRRNPYAYMRAMSPALLTGFSTASSAGTLPLTMERAEKGAGISNRIASFVLPLGATVNMDGTALYECVTVIFIAQVHAATHPEFAALTMGAQILIVFLALIVSIGAAAIPHAGLVMMVIILKAVGLPLEYTALIWAVDRILDMCRTMTNIWSDSTGTAVIAHTENEIDDTVLGSA